MMKKISAPIYFFLIIIAFGLLFFFFLEKEDSLKMIYFIQKENLSPFSEDTGLIYDEIIVNTELSRKQFDYKTKYFSQISDLENYLEDTVKAKYSDICILNFAEISSYESF